MTFKWTFTSAVVIGVAVIALSWIGWGVWAAMSHIHAIILTAIGAAIILLARTGTPRPQVADSQDEPFSGYPQDQMLGIFETRNEASDALHALRNAGFASSDLTLFTGLKGAAQLDSEGTAHGIAEFTQRSIEHIASDIDDLQGYDEAVRRGAVVVGVMAPDEEPRTQAAQIFVEHGGHDLYYFGAFAVQQLDVDRSRTTTD